MTQEAELARNTVIKQLNQTLNEVGIQKVAQAVSAIASDSRYIKD